MSKKFNIRTASKVEFDKELKRIASNKCNAGKAIKAAQLKGEEIPEELQAKYDAAIAEYDKIRKAKAKKFPGRKTYMDYSAEDIEALDLKQTMAGIASLACTRSRYPHRTDEVRKQEDLFQSHKAKLQGKAEARQVLQAMPKEELDALLAELK